MTHGDTLVYYGSPVKALGDGRVGGYLVVFGGPDATDATDARDYFTAETDFELDVTDRTRVLYQHGLDPTLGNRKIGLGTLKLDAAGVWMEAQLAMRDAYERRIYELAKAGKLGLSSGTAEHLVRRERQPNGSHKITAWPLGLDASLTPAPAEPRTLAVPLKSLTTDTKTMAEADDASGGSAAPAEGGAASPHACEAGDHVKWSGYGAMKAGCGTVMSLHAAGNVPGTENHLEATEAEPAARVHVRERAPGGGYKDTGRHQAHPLSRLKPDRAAAKGVQLGDTDEPLTMAALARLNDLFCNTLWRLVASNAYTAEDIKTNLSAAFGEYQSAALAVIDALLGGETPGDDAANQGAAKALLTASGERLHAGLTLDDHSDSVLDAVKGLTDRLGRVAGMRAHQGRALSRHRLDAMKALVDELARLHDRAGRATAAADPQLTESRNRLHAEWLLIEARDAGYLD